MLAEDDEIWDVYKVAADEFPKDDEIGGYDGFVITGSCNDAHGNDAWICELLKLVRKLDSMKKKVLGIFFGDQVVTDPSTGHSKGYGFVKFADEMEKNRAMQEMNGAKCSSRPMRISAATPKKTTGVQNQYAAAKGDLKRICETDLGLITQCCLTKYVTKVSRQYLSNVSLKINVKMGGRNTMLMDALISRIPMVSDTPTIIFGADVTHPENGEDTSPSIAAVVASQDWPEVTKYAGLVSAQPQRQEIIQLRLLKTLPKAAECLKSQSSSL